MLQEVDMRRWVIFLVGTLGAGIGTPALCQDAALAGRITDPQGAAVPEADVRLSREDAAAIRTTTSGATGEYRVDALPPGVFVVEVAKAGFRRRTDVVTLAPGSSATLNVQLEVAGVDDAVVVTAAGLPQVAQETSKAVTIIDAQDIVAQNETALTEIVRFAPGVQVRTLGSAGQASSLRIRGLRTDAAAILIDGMRFRDASTIQADATSFLSTLNFIAADRVEVLRGSGSALYGTNAVGGVVNIVTNPGGGQLRVEGQLEGGSLGRLRARASVSGDAMDARVRYSAGALQFNLFDGLDGNDATRSTGAHGLLHYNVSSFANLIVRVLGSTDRVDTNTSPTTGGIPSANIPQTVTVDARPVAPDQVNRSSSGLPFEVGGATYIPGRDDPDSTRLSAFTTTAVRFQHAGRSNLSWQASYQRVQTRRRFTNGPLGVGFQPPAENVTRINGAIDTVDVRGFIALAPGMSVTAGYEFERELYHDRQDDNLPPPARTQTDTRITQRAHAAFASAQLALANRRLHVAASGRAQGFALSNPRLTAVGTVNPYDEVAIVSPPRAVTGDLSAAYFLAASDTKVRVHGGNAFRAPALYERFGGGFFTDPVTGVVAFTAFGDPRLEPDRYRTLDAGVDQYLFGSRALLSATFFYNWIASLTAFDFSGAIRPDTDPYRRSQGYLNGAGGFSRGLEVSVDGRPTSSIRLSGGYTYTQSETADDTTVPGFFLAPGVVQHVATFAATKRWSERIDTTVDVFHGSATYAAFFAAGRSRAYRFPGFTTAALTAGYRLLNGRRMPLRGYLHVDNLFNRTYYEIGWRMPGRTAVAGVTVGF
jgi:iron complex outermembrane receptor protein